MCDLISSVRTLAAISRLQELAESRMALTENGTRTDVDTIWPSEILEIIDGLERTWRDD